MKVRKLACSLFAITLGLVGSAAVHADGDDNDLIRGSMRACPSDGTVLGGVNSCGKIWKLAHGSAKLGADGKLQIHIKGLVLDDPSTGPDNGTPDGVNEVLGTVICGGSGGSVVGQSAAVPMPVFGNVFIHAKFNSPKHCTVPVIIVQERINGVIGTWLAPSGN